MQLDLPQTWSVAQRNVLPVLRGNTSPANAWHAALGNEDAMLVRQPWAPFIDIVAVLDLPDLRLFINGTHLRLWGVQESHVLAAARENVQPTQGLKPWTEAKGVWQLATGDGYESSRLSLPGWLAAFRDQVPGDPVAVIPDARTLLVCGTESGLPLDRMLHYSWSRFHEVGNPISPAPYTLNDAGSVIPWQPSEAHRLVHRVDACHAFLAGHEYRQQQHPFAEWLKEHDIHRFLAPFSMVRHRSGRVVTFTCWPDMPSLLPKTDLVYLGSPGPGTFDDGLTVTWVDLVLHGIIEEPEPALTPARFGVLRHPEQLAALRAIAVDARSWSAYD
ncbi:MAG: hypothetical protein ACI9MC_003007 [Kiritimatiellia bacterium]|jgi:hypothetical protein